MSSDPQTSTPRLPVAARTSSQAKHDEIEAKLLRCWTSQKTLKHKLSTSSTDSKEYKNLRIEQYDAEIEEIAAERMKLY